MHIFKPRIFFYRLNKKCFDSAQVGLPLKLKSSVITTNYVDIWKKTQKNLKLAVLLENRMT